MKLGRSFYLRPDVVNIARELLGKYLFTNLEGGLTGGVIIETEAYEGVTDRASHAYGHRRTGRTEVMFGPGGHAYIYLCYGIHSLFNIVTNIENIPHAVLVRGVYPVTGLELMRKRTGKQIQDKLSGIGPGRVSALLGLHYSMSGTDLLGDIIWLEDRQFEINLSDIISTRRVGVDYAGEDANLPYRFRLPPAMITSGQ